MTSGSSDQSCRISYRVGNGRSPNRDTPLVPEVFLQVDTQTKVLLREKYHSQPIDPSYSHVGQGKDSAKYTGRDKRATTCCEAAPSETSQQMGDKGSQDHITQETLERMETACLEK